MDEALKERVEGIVWHHAIDLGNGIVTPGRAGLAAQMPLDTLPDFSGRSVLDIGAWDGYYSFVAERGGAKSVTALDHYAWGVDFKARDVYWNECRARGVLPDHDRDTTEFWRPELPGQAGFKLAKEVLGSQVEPKLGDFMAVDLDELGVYDVVLYLGVLYHIKEPLTALERVRKVTSEVAVIETEAVWLRGLEDTELLLFYPGTELNHDYGNWYVPNEKALHGLCRAAGFSRVETTVGPPHIGPRTQVKRVAKGDPPLKKLNYRIVVHAYP